MGGGRTREAASAGSVRTDAAATRGGARSNAAATRGGALSSVPHRLRRALEAAAEWLCPTGASCLVCGCPRLAPNETLLCEQCEREMADSLLEGAMAYLPYAFPRDAAGGSGAAATAAHAPPLPPSPALGWPREDVTGVLRVFNACRYEGAPASLVRSLKFGGVRACAAPFAAAMGDLALRSGCDALTPVPLHARRLRSRGFNQSLCLCEEIARVTGLPILLNAAVRTVYARPQSRKGTSRRRRDVRCAFAPAADLRGLRVALVDDVFTTGATAEACSRALLDAGAASVCVVTACRTDRDR